MNAMRETSATSLPRAASEPLVVLLSGNSGCGKTSLVRAAGARLHDRGGVGAVVATPAARHAADRLSDFVGRLHFIEGHLDCTKLQRFAQTASVPLLLVETVEPLSLCPEARGSHKRVVVFSTAAGNDKVFEYPQAVTDADLVVLTKTDLLPHVPFDASKFAAAIHQLNPSVPIVTVSALRGEGMDAWENWLRAQLEQWSKKSHPVGSPHSDWFMG